ncbi:MAG: DNA repair protein RadC [Chloroflexi bacterium]|nr:DNA repair protein RadC [Chloroflexota bacterium]MBU1749648.1 DNA repair protein RadC [Chloroflexota bacterium]
METPLTRLQWLGPPALSSIELLDLILGSNLGRPVWDLIGALRQLPTVGLDDLSQVPGLGLARAGRLAAAVELGRRLQSEPPEERPLIASPAAAVNILRPQLRDLEWEEVWVLLLDIKNRLIGRQMVYRGSVNTNVVRPAELFREAVRRQATAILVAHNHPSGDPSPSPEDVALTREVVQAGNYLSIDVLDHIVIGRGGRWLSLKEKGLGFD